MQIDHEGRTELDALVERMPEPVIMPLPEAAAEPVLALVPENFKVEDVERMYPTPRRSKGNTRLNSLTSFIDFAKRHREANSSYVLCQACFETGQAKFKAVFNPTTLMGTPGWGDWTASYEMENDVAWKRWMGKNGKAMTQVEFAQWIEDNYRDITPVDGLPSPADMLQMAIAFESQKDARFASDIRLQDGSKELTFVDKENAETRKKMALFERFALALPPFINGPTYRLYAKLRYRAKDGQVSFWYELERPDLVVREAVMVAFDNVDAECGPAYYGVI